MKEMTTYAELFNYITIVPAGVRWAGLTFGTMITAFSLLGNTLLILVITMDIRLRTRTNMYLVSMALAEIITMLGKDLFILATYAVGYWPFNGKVLLVTFIMDRMRIMLAIEHIVIITLYRYVLIVHNKYYRFISNTKFMAFLITFIYIVPLGVFIVNKRNELNQGLDSVLIFNMKYMRMLTLEDFINYGYEFADNTTSTSGHNTTGNTFLSLAENGTPLKRLSNNMIYIALVLSGVAVILLLLYLHIYIFLRRHARKLRAWTNQNQQERTKAIKMSKQQSQEVKFVRTMGLVFIGYTCVYLIFPILTMVDKAGAMSHEILLPFNLLNWGSSCINWIIYVMTNTQIKQGFKKLLTGKSVRVQPADQSQSNTDDVTRTTTM